MADVVCELQAIADAAARRDARSILDAARRAQSQLDRLRAQFVFEVAGPGTPSAVPAVDASAFAEDSPMPAVEAA